MSHFDPRLLTSAKRGEWATDRVDEDAPAEPVAQIAGGPIVKRTKARQFPNWPVVRDRLILRGSAQNRAVNTMVMSSMGEQPT